MTLLQLIIIVVVVGLVLWVINTYIPMEATIKRILNIAVIIILVVYLLSVSGVLPDLNAIRIGK